MINELSSVGYFCISVQHFWYKNILTDGKHCQKSKIKQTLLPKICRKCSFSWYAGLAGDCNSLGMLPCFCIVSTNCNKDTGNILEIWKYLKSTILRIWFHNASLFFIRTSKIQLSLWMFLCFCNLSIFNVLKICCKNKA